MRACACFELFLLFQFQLFICARHAVCSRPVWKHAIITLCLSRHCPSSVGTRGTRPCFHLISGLQSIISGKTLERHYPLLFVWMNLYLLKNNNKHLKGNERSAVCPSVDAAGLREQRSIFTTTCYQKANVSLHKSKMDTLSSRHAGLIYLIVEIQSCIPITKANCLEMVCTWNLELQACLTWRSAYGNLCDSCSFHFTSQLTTILEMYSIF